MRETQLNRVELIGTVGSCRIQEAMETRIARFTVATNYAYKSKDGCPVIETTWSTAVFLDKAGGSNCLDQLAKGTKVHLIGRLRNQRITGEDGTQRTLTEIAVSNLEVMNQDEPLLCETAQ